MGKEEGKKTVIFQEICIEAKNTFDRHIGLAWGGEPTALTGPTLFIRRGAYLVVSRSKHLYYQERRLSRFGGRKSAAEREGDNEV